QATCEWLRFHQRYHEVRLHLLTHGVEAFTGTLEHMLSQGIRNVVAVPYMLQMSKDDLATLLGYAEHVAASLPELQLIMAPHLGYDQRLVTALQQRLAEAVRKARANVAAKPILAPRGLTASF
ncbi:MAG TPA: hypothetical protein VFT99_20840, partial [Roseiflexaceae bacterium]|nr:hypothetical protein [Roseiflexaceae bacterium]